MKRILRAIPVLVAVAVLATGMAAYNHYDTVMQRKDVHRELQDRVLGSAVAKEYKAIDTGQWQAMAESGELERLLGEEIVVTGYGLPINDDHVYDMAGLLKADACCPEPVLYKNVTSLDVSPLPYDSYLMQTTPDAETVRVVLAEGRIEFPSNAPRLFQGVLEKSTDGGRPYTLANATKVDLSKGMPQRAQAPPSSLGGME